MLFGNGKQHRVTRRCSDVPSGDFGLSSSHRGTAGGPGAQHGSRCSSLLPQVVFSSAVHTRRYCAARAEGREALSGSAVCGIFRRVSDGISLGGRQWHSPSSRLQQRWALGSRPPSSPTKGSDGLWARGSPPCHGQAPGPLLLVLRQQWALGSKLFSVPTGSAGLGVLLLALAVMASLAPGPFLFNRGQLWAGGPSPPRPRPPMGSGRLPPQPQAVMQLGLEVLLVALGQRCAAAPFLPARRP